jgi:hypothetical protein
VGVARVFDVDSGSGVGSGAEVLCLHVCVFIFGGYGDFVCLGGE